LIQVSTTEKVIPIIVANIQGAVLIKKPYQKSASNFWRLARIGKIPSWAATLNLLRYAA
jgi:hypothetical protein